MISIKTKIVGEDGNYQYIKLKKYKTKHTNTMEHLCLIDVLVKSILDNEEKMSINKLCKLIKENYNTKKEGNDDLSTK